MPELKIVGLSEKDKVRNKELFLELSRTVDSVILNLEFKKVKEGWCGNN
jgi:hypothetical protein